MATRRLEGDEVLQQRLRPHVHHALLTATGDHFLTALAEAVLVHGCVEPLFLRFEHLVPEIAARLCARLQRRRQQPQNDGRLEDVVQALDCLARIYPFAKHLGPAIVGVVGGIELDGSQMQEISDGVLETLLLALFRLLSTQAERFSEVVKPTFLSGFLSHKSLVVRYLAVQCLCIVMRFADALEQKLVVAHVAEGEILGVWEGKSIDFRLMKLFEEKRWMELEEDLRLVRLDKQNHAGADETRFTKADLSLNTASIGGILLPRNGPLMAATTSFVETPTSLTNLRLVGAALLQPKPILVTGHGGSGKTTLIRESARLLNRLPSIITLHLNEQTDAKSLLGVYTSSSSGESFVWQPGVLTKAVQQGRWVLIEDIDKAPSEVLGVLRPIIENGELFLPSRKERIRPSKGFRLLATIKTSSKSERGNVGRHSWLANQRLWSTVEVQTFSDEEIHELLKHRYPDIAPLIPGILRAHNLVTEAYTNDLSFRAVQGRLPSLRDLLKWCRRADRRVQSQGLVLDTSGMPEQTRLHIFKDGVDCYAAFHSDTLVKQSIIERIAETLNVSPQQMEHSISSGVFDISENKTEVTVGRSVLQKTQTRRSNSAKKVRFAMTNQAKRTMDSTAAGINYSEPLLLVGETGVGKTTQAQHIANLVNQKLTVVNLSQQSEAADLLGGLKPITTRSMIIPLVDEFGVLFDDTFSSKRNEKFQVAISKAVARENWPRLVLLWQEAVQMAETSLKKPFESSDAADGEGQSVKRRKLIFKYGPLRDRWSKFTSKLNRIRAQVERGDKNHAFAFVEGRLVQAVRSGEWLLLDEINLASADTLDHVIGLLSNGDDEQPSLLLTEAGNIEQVTAHPNFRIFAAMNPATDTGKKDLAPGIRSRFTEIYVDTGDNDVDDLVKIIETYLGAVLSSDKRAALDLARAYLQLKKLNEEHRLTDGAGDIPHFSIRSLVRCLLYVIQHNASHGLRRSIYEGFAMTFFTVLSIESEKLALSQLTSHLLSNVKNAKSFLAQQPKMSSNGDEHVAFGHHLVLRGTNSPDLQPHYIRTPSVERNLINLARAASMRRFPILLQGPTSAGKTSMVEYLAKLSGNQFVRINNHEHTDLQEYLGSYATGNDGRLEFREGVLVEALRKGHWIVLDELNLAPSDVLEALNRLLDDNRELLIPESQEIVRPHPTFMLFATQNPAGLYGGRKRLSRAFRNRFLELHFDDIPEDELEVILRERAQIAPSFCTQIVQVYKKLSLQRQSTRLFESRNSFATLRDLFRWAARKVDDRQELARHGFMLLAERVRDSAERQLVKSTIEETMKVKLDESELYGIHSIPESVQSSTDIVWTSAMRRLFVLVSEALKNNEPVLLVGETGCGKTQICQTVAQAFQTHLSIYNAHSNTETGDLIGSQRPIRQRSGLASALLDSFIQLWPSNGPDSMMESKNIDELIDALHNMDTSEFEPSAVERTRQSIAAYQSLFVWSDGSLIRSMKGGEHFLLDEISLADDSVLERLNSVLEPSRTILLAEKGPVDNLVVADPSFQFLATMNPGGDYGKRELSAALRNRLTEIWVPPLSENHDILPILTDRLGDLGRRFAQPMLTFAIWFKENMQNSAASTIPLRSLLAWAEFICKLADLGPDHAFVHGASMVYIDSLGANPAGLTTMLDNDVRRARQACLQTLQSLTSIDVLVLYNEIPQLSIGPDELRVGPFLLPRSVANCSVSDLVFDAPTTLRNTMRIARALQMYRPILLEGSPGVGKTAIVSALAATLGKRLTRINLSDQTDLMDLFGADAPSENEKLGRFSWRDGPLLQAMQTGGWVLLDEMNLASQSVLEGLNSCLDHRHEVYIAELDKSFTCHPEFTLFAAQNPHHQGGGRKGLPASFVNRFTVVYADSFEKEDLMLICRQKKPKIPEDQLSAIINTISYGHELISQSPAFSAGGPWELNLRDVNRWLDMIQECETLPIRHHFGGIVTQRFRSSTARSLLDQVVDRNLEEEPESSLYHNLSQNVFQLGTSFMERDSFQQHVVTGRPLAVNHIPYAKSVITAINHRWPVILVGPTGCGKTALIRNLAALSGAKLVEFSMNADVDTMDLIGGFEQYDFRRDVLSVQRATCNLLMELLRTALMLEDNSQTITALSTAYESCSASDIDIEILEDVLVQLSKRLESFKTLHKQFVEIKSRSEGSRFVWNDGTLIDALQDGSWLVLDNANLCNPSVLDRLNSLLEPNGVLAVSEQHGSGDQERVIVPHPGFRIFLTMDPKYGELSRAMRNRSLELFMQSQEDPKTTLSLSPIYTTTSSIYRSRPLLQQLSRTEVAGPVSLSVEPYIGALSFDDFGIVVSQAKNIVKENCGATAVLRTDLDSYLHMSSSLRNMWPSILSSARIYISSASQRTHVRAENQPQTFIINDALLQLLEGRSHTPQVDLYARQYFIELQRAQLQYEMENAIRAAAELDQSQSTILQKSMSIGQKSKDRRRDTVPNAYDFLLKIVNETVNHSPLLTTKESVLGVQSLVALARDMFDLFDRHTLDFGVFHAYIQIAQSCLQDLPFTESVLKRSLEEALSYFDTSFTLQSGQSLHRMWLKWKPKTAATQEQLQAQISIEDLLDRFDSIAKHLSNRRNELAAVRSSLCSAYQFITEDNEPSNTVATFSKAIEALAVQRPPGKIQVGHFASAFEWALRKLIVQGKKISELDYQRLSLFAMSPPVALDQSPFSLPCTLSRLAYLSSSGNRNAVMTGQRLLSDLINVENEPLSVLSYVQDEVSELANTIGSYTSSILADEVLPILNYLHGIVTGILICHGDCLTPQACSYLKSDVTADFVKLVDLGKGALKKDQALQVGHFNDIYVEHLLPVLTALAQDAMPSIRVVGACLAIVSIAALKLFVPDKPVDPSTYPTVINQRHRKRIMEISARVAAYQDFQSRFTGQQTSTIIRMFEQDLKELGEAPEVPTVVRPVKSGLSSVQHEFTMVIKNILGASQLATIFDCLSPRNPNPSLKIRNCNVLQTTISRVVDRLSRLDRAYDDIVKPVLWLLGSLSLGTELMTKEIDNDPARSNRSLLKSVPLLGGLPKITLGRFPETILTRKRTDVQWLELVQFQSQIRHAMKREITDDFLSLIDKFYVEWKERLTKDQAEAEAESRYYAYRGEDDQAQEIDEAELASMFPTYDQDSETQSSMENMQYDSRSTSIKLAELHSKLNDQESSTSLKDYIRRLSKDLSKSDQLAQGSSLDDLLSGVFLQIEQTITGLHKAEPTQGLNIYTDSDVVESQNLVKLVRSIQVRFTQISEQWPEHAVPAEVLSYSEELLAFKINEPIAKLLTKTEKLLDIVSQWQSVASREWSVTDHINSLTQTIVHWRRLELSSWSRLLEIERNKSVEDANAWYFIAYEAVVYNSRLVAEQTNDVSTYCQELAKTLEDFLRSTTLGQFSNRLNLLKAFDQTLKIIAEGNQELVQIENCVVGILSHYSRYEPSIQQTLASGRAPLEKDIVEQMKLASWKDTNVQSLRDSARRSHHKLFKIVRKYRALLSQPITSFKAVELDMSTNPILQEVSISGMSHMEQIERSIDKCAREVHGWRDRRPRQTDPFGTATIMRKLYNKQNTDFSISEEIAGFRIDIATTAAELRKETPQTLTDDNATLVRHLRERKRRLLAETMRTVAQMGVRRNMATSELDKQSSVYTILAYSPDVVSTVETTTTTTTTARAANDAFHEVVDLMPGVRKAAVEHSDDLTEGETRRVIGLLEGLLSIQIAQRAELSTTLADMQEFESKIRLLKNMQRVEPENVCHLPEDVALKQQHLDGRLAWLPQMLEVSCHVLKFQSTQGGLEVTELIDALEQETQQLVLRRAELQGLPALPPRLGSTTCRDMMQDIEEQLACLDSLCSHWQEQEPNVAYLLKQICLWTKPLDIRRPPTNGVFQTRPFEIDASITDTLDSISVVMQNVPSTLSKLPDSVEEQGWLVKSDKILSDCVKLLHLDSLTSEISDILSQLQHLHERSLALGVSILVAALPILEQYYMIASHVHQRQLYIHYETCRLSAFLTKSFASLATEGFCTPHKPSDGQEQQSGKLESGTGLGDGEGAEDISKDIGDDEDLSELAQAGAEKQDGDQEMNKEKDAVDMGADDLEGEIGSDDERDSDQQDDKEMGSDEEDDMDEETGSVDSLDPSAVDEKLWDDMRKENEKEKEMKGDKQKGQKSDEQTAREEGAREEGDDEMEDSDDDSDIDDDDEAEGQSRPEAENLDPRLQEEQALDLPEEMQLNGEEDGKEDEISDDDMDDLSDVDHAEQPVSEKVDELDEDGVEERGGSDIDKDDKVGSEDEEAEGRGQDDEIVEDQMEDEPENEQDNLDTRGNETQYDLDDNEGGDTGTANQQTENVDETQRNESMPGQNDKDQIVNEQQTQPGKGSDNEQSGDAARGTLEQGTGKENEQRQDVDDALKNLASILEQYHQRREILTASEERKEGELEQDVDMADADFEHLGDDEQDADAQALGAASADQVQKIDESKAIEHPDADADQDLPIPEDQEMKDQEWQETIAERFSKMQNQPRHQPKDTDAGGLISERSTRPQLQSSTQDDLDEDDTADDDDQPLTNQHPTNDPNSPTLPTSAIDATTLWHHSSTRTHALSLQLTEQLRLILAPTSATKLRGDFRTGKRLNIKRIIPYIASGYKRDKIWMRRSVPSKRTYQVMIAVDDSKSMAESGADLLAFETLAMLCKSLSMLEVGEISVVTFGDQDTIRVAHPFGTPFSGADSGVDVFRHFGFQQRGTDVRSLLVQSLALFEEARLRSSGSGSDDLWQLQLIVSDGHCSDHDAIRRLVRKAQEQRVVVVFVVVDAGPDSIVDLKEAVFEPVDPADVNSEMRVRTKRYLEGFPFPYYVVVRDVVDLPGVLARVLRGWFEGVVNVG